MARTTYRARKIAVFGVGRTIRSNRIDRIDRIGFARTIHDLGARFTILAEKLAKNDHKTCFKRFKSV